MIPPWFIWCHGVAYTRWSNIILITEIIIHSQLKLKQTWTWNGKMSCHRFLFTFLYLWALVLKQLVWVGCNFRWTELRISWPLLVISGLALAVLWRDIIALKVFRCTYFRWYAVNGWVIFSPLTCNVIGEKPWPVFNRSNDKLAIL